MNDPSQPPKIRHVSPPQAQDAYRCLLYVRLHEGQFIARAAELAELTATGATQREAIQRATALVKEVVRRQHAAGEPIPWLPAPLEKQADEHEVYLAVHL